MAYVYLLKCSDGSYYAGSTRNLDERVAQHATGKGAEYTSTRLPIELVWFAECESVQDAWGLERKLHGWGRAKREALIRGQYESLPGLSRKKNWKKNAIEE